MFDTSREDQNVWLPSSQTPTNSAWVLTLASAEDYLSLGVPGSYRQKRRHLPPPPAPPPTADHLPGRLRHPGLLCVQRRHHQLADGPSADRHLLPHRLHLRPEKGAAAARPCALPFAGARPAAPQPSPLVVAGGCLSRFAPSSNVLMYLRVVLVLPSPFILQIPI